MYDALTDLERFLHEDGLPLLVRVALTHYQFEAIHPFLDGNGRVGRLLIPLILIDRDVLPVPLLYVSAYFERKRDAYYDLLLATSQHGQLDPWLDFFMQAVAVSARDAEERTVRLVELQASLRENLLSQRTPMSVVRLSELVASRPVVTVSQVAEALDVRFPTAQRAIDALVERGLLTEVTGRSRGRVYVANGILEAVYGEPLKFAEPRADTRLPEARGEE
jgi:Fic family protein